MSKVNHFTIPALALAGILAIGSVVGMAQTNTPPAQSGQSGAAAQPDAPDSGPMMGGWGRGMMGYGGMGPGMMSQGGMGPWMMDRGGFGPRMCAAMAGHVEGRLAYLKAELKLTSAQEPLWQSYAAVARENANGMVARCATMMSQRRQEGLSLPDRMDLHQQFMAAQLDSLRAVNKALRPLYESFSDEQKRTADQMFWGPMGMM